MADIRINVSELKSEGSDLIKELTTYLKDKTKAEVDAGTDELVVKAEEGSVSKAYLRVLLRKFLHRNELRDYFRVIAGKENTLIVKGKKAAEEEE